MGGGDSQPYADAHSKDYTVTLVGDAILMVQQWIK